MPERSSNNPKKKRPRDANQLAKQIVDEATGQAPPEADENEPKKNPAAVELGRLGGKKGGPARAKKLTAKQRKRIAEQAAKARWGSKQDQNSQPSADS